MAENEETTEQAKSEEAPKPTPRPRSRRRTKAEKDDIHGLAQEVLRGEHGRGEDRKKSLGKNYEAVQAEVLKIRKGN